MDKDELYRLLVDDDLEVSDISRLKSIVDQYPYFQGALFLYLKAVYLYDSKSFRGELTKYSVFVQDRKALFFYILKEEYNQFFNTVERRKLSEDRTSILLDAFFETKGNDFDDNFEYNLSSTTLASSDYLAYIGNINDVSDEVSSKTSNNLKHQNIIDSFIEKADEGINIQIDATDPSKSTPIPNIDKEEELADDLFFTETLAKIYVKQHKYEKAYKIIKHLSLNYPKKNIYFADQLSFLEKLIINSKFEDKK